MKYKITLNGKTYEVEVEAGQAMLVDEYEAYKHRCSRRCRRSPLPLLRLLPLPHLPQPAAAPAPLLLPPAKSSRPRCPATS